MNDIKCAACGDSFGQGATAVFMGSGQPVHDRCQKLFHAQKMGRTHKCPVCGGSGQVNDTDQPVKETVRDHDAEEADAYNGSMAVGHRYKSVVVAYRPKACGACDGWGYWDHEPKPIVETTTKILGYK